MNLQPRICLVEDDAIMGESLHDRFALEGFDCEWFRDAQSALDHLGKNRFHAVVSDIRLPDFSGEELFERLSAREVYLPPWIFITGYGTIDRAIALLKLGAADYVTKPFDLDQLIGKLRLYVPPSLAGDRAPTLGLSPGMRRIEAMLPRLLGQTTTILITGPSGVGKEVVARQVHALDPRRAGASFVAVNCGGIPESLLEAELFGYERGAFTGAVKQKRGLIEQAKGGTLFLDEIGDMPLAMQVKLLRVLQDRAVTRVGGVEVIPIDFRLICATHRDLRKLVEQDAFREDLFYRINVVHLRVPPLRDRSEDVIWYAQRFLREFAQHTGGKPKTLTRAAEKALLAHLWPGNVRELRHCIERAYVLTPGDQLDPQVLFDDETAPGKTGPEAQAPNSLGEYLEACEREYLVKELARHEWQMGTTAQAIGISRKNLWERLRRLQVAPPKRALGRGFGGAEE
ncbi:MAG TPA: sigma-54 dependent transcriptional regulator [Casimicrobiaceae bacterium]